VTSTKLYVMLVVGGLAAAVVLLITHKAAYNAGEEKGIRETSEQLMPLIERREDQVAELIQTQRETIDTQFNAISLLTNVWTVTALREGATLMVCQQRNGRLNCKGTVPDR